MARQKAQVEANQYVKGLITEAGRMTFPEDASVYEKNFVLHPSGKRERRKGIGRQGGLIRAYVGE